MSLPHFPHRTGRHTGDIHSPGARSGQDFRDEALDRDDNDTQHEWLKRFGALVEKESGGRIKAEIYPASQLGSIPRQIEGVQFGSIQGWMGPPEFLVGVDERYEAMTAPGLFTDHDQVMRVMNEPATRQMVYGLGEPKGVVGVGFATMSPSSILARKPVAEHLRPQGNENPRAGFTIPDGADATHGRIADFNDAWRRASGIQQGTIDGTLSGYHRLHHDALLRRLQIGDSTNRAAVCQFPRHHEQALAEVAATRSEKSGAEGRRTRCPRDWGSQSLRQGFFG